MPLNDNLKRLFHLFLLLLVLAVFPIMGVEQETGGLADFFGINGMDFFARKDIPEIQRTIRYWLDSCKELGIRRQRIRFDMGAVEPEKGRFEWDFPDLLVKEFERKDIEMIPIVYRDSPMDPYPTYSVMGTRGEYCDRISLLMERYSKDIRIWEIFDKPPFSPDPDHYAGYLKSTLIEARMRGAKPPLVVAAFTDPYDLASLESLYNAMGVVHCDILSFPYYPEVMDENELQRLLIDIQYLKKRFGNDDKKIWISEMGIPSESDGSASYSPDKAAEWMVKAHIAALASGIVDCVFWNSLFDNQISTDEKHSGSYGLFWPDHSPKPAFFAYRAMSRLLKDRDYAGSLSIHPNVKAYLFQNGKNKVMIAWAEKEEYHFALTSTESLTLVNLFGVEQQLNPGKGIIRVSLSRQPVYITEIKNQADIFASLGCSPAVIYTYPGESGELTATFDNPGNPGMLAEHISVSVPEGVMLPKYEWKLTGKNRAGFSKILKFNISPDLKPGFYRLGIQVDTNDPLCKSLFSSASIRVLDPLKIDLRGRQEDHKFKIETRIENTGLSPLQGALTWDIIPGGKVQALPQKFTLKSNDTLTTESNLIAGNKEARLIASVKLNNGYFREEGIGLMSIPFRLASPRMDGSLSEWINVPQLHLKRQSLKGDASDNPPQVKRETEGIFQFWVTENDLYIGARIYDRTPFTNPFRNGDINKGDGIEIFLGLEGPHRSGAFGDLDFHIGLNPGHNGDKPCLWNWTMQNSIPEGEIFSSKTLEGYIVEAKIPFASLGAWKPGRDLMIGFDLALNNLDERTIGKPPHTLFWNGYQDNRQNPSGWGLAIIW